MNGCERERCGADILRDRNLWAFGVEVPFALLKSHELVQFFLCPHHIKDQGRDGQSVLAAHEPLTTSSRGVLEKKICTVLTSATNLDVNPTLQEYVQESRRTW